MRLRLHRSNGPSREDLLARLADGSIDADDRAELEREVEASPELAAKLAEQRRAISIVTALDVEAPAGLLERIAQPPGRTSRRAQGRIRARGLILVAGVIIVLAVVAARIHRDDVSGEAHLALARATLAAPARSTTDPDQLIAAVSGVAFPYWREQGWTTTGARVDSFDGRSVETVFYSSPDYGRVGYSIVAGAPLAVGSATSIVRTGGVTYSVLSADGATVVTWLRDGHTCVLAAQRAPAATLLALADSA
jgi:ferric-dicitrate binding protein FerR (iron transport regulator)